MTVNEIVALAQAGFTATQISNFAQVQQTVPHVQQTVPHVQQTVPQVQQTVPQVQQTVPQVQNNGYTPVLPEGDMLGEALMRAKQAQESSVLFGYNSMPNTMENIVSDILGANSKGVK